MTHNTNGYLFNPEEEYPQLRHYNDLPLNYTEIDEIEFWSLFDNSYQHLTVRGGKYITNAPKDHKLYGQHIQWFINHHGMGYGYVREARYNSARSLYDRKPRHFFKFYQCDHKMVEDHNYNGGRCMHRYYCTNDGCNYSYTVDSSD